MKIVILSGAGISAESGVKTFRDSDGLWENHDVMEVASIDGWNRNMELVLDFYNKRRAQLKDVIPNEAHIYCQKLEEEHHVNVITQNVDDLHERAGSQNILHLHGSLLLAKSVKNDSLVYEWKDDILPGNMAEDGHQLRPGIVWFGEAVPAIGAAIEIVKSCDVLIIVGTSLQVYPAASIVGFAHHAHSIYLIDPAFVESYETKVLGNKLKVIKDIASSGMKFVFEEINKMN